MQREDTDRLRNDLERRACRDIKQFFEEEFSVTPPDLESAGKLLIRAGYKPTPMPRASYLRKNYNIPSSLQPPNPERWTGRVFLLGTFYHAMGNEFELSPEHQETLASDYGLALAQYSLLHLDQAAPFRGESLSLLEAVLEGIDEMPPPGVSGEGLDPFMDAPRTTAEHLGISRIHDTVSDLYIQHAISLPVEEHHEPLHRARYHRSRSIAHPHSNQALQFLGVAHIQALLASHAFHTRNFNAGQAHIISFVHYFLKDALTEFGADSFTLFSSDLDGSQEEYGQFVRRAQEIITVARGITGDSTIPQEVKDYCIEEFMGMRTLLPARDVDLGAIARDINEDALPATPEAQSKLEDLRRIAPAIAPARTESNVTIPSPYSGRQKGKKQRRR